MKQEMPGWRKSPPELVEIYDRVLAKLPAADRRQMFGNPVAFANDNLFTGLHQEQIFVRLPEADRVLIIEAGGVPFESMAGRVMKEYVVLSQAIVNRPATLVKWVRKSMVYAGALPPKKKKQRRQSHK
ncbi:MAG: TfoX/Sxy family protein [Thermoleophilia bacterium]